MKYPYDHTPPTSVSDAIDAAMVTVSNTDPLGYDDTVNRVLNNLKTAKLLLEGTSRKEQLKFAWDINDAQLKMIKEQREELDKLKKGS